jgi:hypothetical protein
MACGFGVGVEACAFVGLVAYKIICKGIDVFSETLSEILLVE